MIKVHTVHSRLFRLLGNTRDAEGHARLALAAIEAVASSIADEDLRIGFESAWLCPLDQLGAGN